MASRNAALKALLVAALVTSLLLLVQGRVEDFSCHTHCDGKRPCKVHCTSKHCQFYYNGPLTCQIHGMDVAVAAGGGGLDKGNDTETGAAPSP